MKSVIHMLMVSSLLMCFQCLRAQDTIVKRDGRVVVCEITDILESTVNYTLPGKQEDTLRMQIRRIEKIILSDGRVIIFRRTAKKTGKRFA